MVVRQSAGRLASLALLHLCLLSACVSTRHEARSAVGEGEAASMLARVQAVAFPLLLASADWCPFDQEPTYGFLLMDRPVSRVGEETKAAKGVLVSQVYPRSPATMVDLRVGDQVFEVNTRDVAEDSAEAVIEIVRRLTRARIQPLQLDLGRSSHRHQVYLDAVPACQFAMQVFQADVVNGLSNGRQIGVTTGLMRFVHSDDELAWVLAHEIAHNALGHVPAAKLRAMLNTWLGATVGEAAPLSAPPQSVETQADYVGAYFMARAGYDLQAVRRFWQRLGDIEAQQPSSGQGFERSHPTTLERLATFGDTLKEIEGKRARGEPLDPMIGAR